LSNPDLLINLTQAQPDGLASRIPSFAQNEYLRSQSFEVRRYWATWHFCGLNQL